MKFAITESEAYRYILEDFITMFEHSQISKELACNCSLCREIAEKLSGFLKIKYKGGVK